MKAYAELRDNQELDSAQNRSILAAMADSRDISLLWNDDFTHHSQRSLSIPYGKSTTFFGRTQVFREKSSQIFSEPLQTLFVIPLALFQLYENRTHQKTPKTF